MKSTHHIYLLGRPHSVKHNLETMSFTYVTQLYQQTEILTDHCVSLYNLGALFCLYNVTFHLIECCFSLSYCNTCFAVVTVAKDCGRCRINMTHKCPPRILNESYYSFKFNLIVVHCLIGWCVWYEGAYLLSCIMGVYTVPYSAVIEK